MLSGFLQEWSQPMRFRDIVRELIYLRDIFGSFHDVKYVYLQQLWATLLVIDQSVHPEVLIRSWKDEQSSLYTFSQERDHVQVKFSSVKRQHHFKQQELYPMNRSHLLIASLQLIRTDSATNGRSIQELVRRILSRLSSPEYQAKLHDMVSRVVGLDCFHYTQLRFDDRVAANSLRYFDVRDISKLKDQPCREISDISYNVTLDGIPPVQDPDSSFTPTNSALYKACF